MVLRCLLVCFIVEFLMSDVSPRSACAQNSASVDAAMVAKLPWPGTVCPTAIGFTPDGNALTYLLPEGPDSLARALWRVDLPAGTPRVIARAPDGTKDQAPLSREDELRRERQRLRDTGISQIARADNADVIVTSIGGDVYMIHGAGPMVQLTESKSPEIDPKPSADGTKVAFVRDGELFVVDVASKQETQLTQGAADGLTHGLAEFMAQEEMSRSTGYWWSPDGTRIAYQETDERHIPLYAIPHIGDAEYSVETHRYPFAGKANAKVKLGVVAVDGGETTWLTIADEDEDFYLARVNWDGSKHLLVQTLSRDQKSLRLFRVDVEANKRKVLIEERADTWVNLHDDLRTIDDRNELIWSSERSGFRRVALHDRDGKLIRELTPDGWNIDGVVAVDADRRELWFAGNAVPSHAIESQLHRVSLDGGEPELVGESFGTRRAVVSRNGDYYVETHSNRTQPPLTALRDRTGKIVTRLHNAAADPRVKNLVLKPPVQLEFTNRDGDFLRGEFYKPIQRDAGATAPLVVMVYGGPHVQRVANSWESSAADMMAQLLAARGFAVWKCDNRGSARRGHAFEAALNRRMGTVEVADQADGVRFLSREFPQLIDADRVGITGGSYGGYMTLRCMELAPDVFQAGVAVAPVTDWAGYDTCYTERYMGTPENNADGYRDSSVLTHVEKLRGKLLVIHGLLDENVHFRHSARLASALIAAGKPFEFLPIPNERHSSRKIPERQYVAERTANFFQHVLMKR